MSFPLPEENRKEIREHEGVPKIIGFLSSKDKSLKQYSAGCLLNLAADGSEGSKGKKKKGEGKIQILTNIKNQEQIKREIRENDGIAPLIDLLNGDNMEIKQNAAGALGAACTDETNAHIIRELGGIPALVECLKLDDQELLSKVFVRFKSNLPPSPSYSYSYSLIWKMFLKISTGAIWNLSLLGNEKQALFLLTSKKISIENKTKRKTKLRSRNVTESNLFWTFSSIRIRRLFKTLQ